MAQAQQHAIWKALFLQNLQDNRPRALAQMQADGTLESYLTELATDFGRQMEALVRQGLKWDEASALVRENLLLQPEPEADEAMPESEGFKAHRELIQGLNNLRMPGEREE
jgi:hypothetical protein